MNKKDYAQSKGRKKSGRFSSFPHSVLNHSDYQSLSLSSRALLIELLRQFNGKNNGDLTIAFKILKPQGFNSRRGIVKSIEELIEKKLVIQTRQGGRNKCSLFALSWLDIDECKGKLDDGWKTIKRRMFKLEPLVHIYKGSPIGVTKMIETGLIDPNKGQLH